MYKCIVKIYKTVKKSSIFNDFSHFENEYFSVYFLYYVNCFPLELANIKHILIL